MARNAQVLFLEEWLRSNSNSGTSNQNSSRNSPTSYTQTIIQTWAELRDCLQQGSFHPQHLQSLRSLLSLQASLYVADPQAKLLLSILSSPNISLPHDSYPLFFRFLYIWLRKSSKPSSVLINHAVEVVCSLLSNHFHAYKSFSLLSEGVLLLGALSCVPSLSDGTRTACSEQLYRLLEEEYRFIGSIGELAPDVLAGIGYALSSSGKNHFVRLLNFLLGPWVKIEEPCDISHGLMILHLIEWVLFGFINARSLEKIRVFVSEILENSTAKYAAFSIIMAASGALRALSRSVKHDERINDISRLRVCAAAQIEAVAANLVSKIEGSPVTVADTGVSFLLQCLSLATARSGSLDSTKGTLLVCLAFALLTEIFPLREFYRKILECPVGDSGRQKHVEVKKHLDGILFKEAGAVTGVFCKLYASACQEDKINVEDLMWGFCHDIYQGHRKIAMLLRGRVDELLDDLEKVAGSAFLMIVVFALAVAKQRLAPKESSNTRMNVSVKILVSFSCMEYFRRVRIPEYLETIRAVVPSLREIESACVSFIESVPSYSELTNHQEFSCLQNMKYIWFEDEVQTARLLFYLRLIPTSVERLPTSVFKKVVAATMFLYMGHPNVKVARAAHSVFTSFVSSSKDSDEDERTSLKEQLVFYYIERSLEAYPGFTPIDSFASGVSALVRHLPAGSPSIYYCIHSLVDKANNLCRKPDNQDARLWKNWQGEPEPCKKLLELLLRLLSLVDIQVLPELMKLMAQLVLQLPKTGQNMVLNELHSLVAESDDVTRKPALVSWLQSLSFLSSQSSGGGVAYKAAGDVENGPGSDDSVGSHPIVSRL